MKQALTVLITLLLFSLAARPAWTQNVEKAKRVPSVAKQAARSDSCGYFPEPLRKAISFCHRWASDALAHLSCPLHPCLDQLPMAAPEFGVLVPDHRRWQLARTWRRRLRVPLMRQPSQPTKVG